MFKKISTFFTTLVALAYVLASLTPYISSVDWWPMTFLALGYPFIFMVMVVTIIGWLFVKKKVAFALCLVLLFGYKNLFSTLAINLNAKPLSTVKEPGILRILNWNVQDFTNSAVAADSLNANRRQIMNYIKQYQPDIICMQDFTELYAPATYSNVVEIRDSLHYPYFYFAVNIGKSPPYGTVNSGVAIFSRYPIVDSGSVELPKIVYNEKIAFVDILLNNKKLRIFNTHLSSMQLFIPDDVERDTAWEQYDNGFIYRATMFEKLRRYDQLHVQQAQKTKAILKQSPYPFIFCGDLNTTPAGTPYHIISKNLKDAFLQQGSGLGATYDNRLPTIRIDYILTSPSLTAKRFKKDNIKCSDHYPVMADIKLPD